MRAAAANPIVGPRVLELDRHAVHVRVPVAPVRGALVSGEEGDFTRERAKLGEGGDGGKARVADAGEERVLGQTAAQAPGGERAYAPAENGFARRLPGHEERTVKRGTTARTYSIRVCVSVRVPRRSVDRDRVGTRDVPRVVRVPRRGRHRARWAGDVRE